MEERELRERVNPVPPYHLHDNFRGFCHPVITIEVKPNISPKVRPNFTRTLHPTVVFIFSLQSQLQLFPTRKQFHCFSLEGPAVTRHSRTKERMKERKKISYCCTIPFIRFALFRLHLYRLNYMNKIVYPKLIFSKCFEILVSYL